MHYKLMSQDNNVKWKEALQQEGDIFAIRGNMLVEVCGGVARDCGWDNAPVDIPRSLMLIVSELAEGMEGHRKGLMDDKLPQHLMLHVELADAAIRIFHLARRLDIPLGTIMLEKLLFNTQRADHKPENRAKEGGKAY